ncbi:MAG: LysR family transcriptional regulator [Candidatus Sulfotelmatobacter sp.]
MEIRHLRAFLALSENGSLLAAAKKLGVTTSTVSRQAFGLERELNVRLLVRRRGAIVLTDAGRIMKSHAKNILKYILIASDAVRTAGKDT